MSSPQPVRVLVVDDSTVVRRLVASAIEQDPRISVVGTAANGSLALAKLDLLAPDVVTLDIEMPVMDGLTALREIRRRRPRLPVIMFSTLTERGAQATLEALSAGANDYVTKPTNTGAIVHSMNAVRDQLVPRILALHGAARPAYQVAPPKPPVVVRPPVDTPAARADVLAVGCSTGGPEALAALLSALPASLPVPVVVVQHMPALFTKLFAERLDRTCALTVVESAGKEVLRPGCVYIAPGDFHLEVVAAGAEVQTRLQTGPPENYCRPAVDVLFRSVAATYGGSALAVVLTGMGSDGRRGAEPLVQAGARVLVQDAETSVVWGMPGAVAAAGLAHAVLPLPKLAPAVLDALAVGRSAARRAG